MMIFILTHQLDSLNGKNIIQVYSHNQYIDIKNNCITVHNTLNDTNNSYRINKHTEFKLICIGSTLK